MEKNIVRKQIAAGAIMTLLIMALLMIAVYLAVRPDSAPEWTGIGMYEYPTKEHAEVVPAKTLWDWLDLLIAPMVLVGAAALFNWLIQRSEKRVRGDLEAVRKIVETQREIAERNRKNSQALALQKQLQTTFDTYIDRMSTLALTEGLLSCADNVTARSIARTRTLTALRSFATDPQWAQAVFRFIENAELQKVVSLFDGNLTHVQWESIDLRGANLQGANLRKACLTEANLRRIVLKDAVLRNAILCQADLSDANLSGARLGGADLTDANLNGAKGLTDKQLLKAKSLERATMPEGTRYEEWLKRRTEDGRA